MITNPLQIEPGTFFISGHDVTTDNVPNKDFEEIEKFLTEKGQKVFNPHGREDCEDKNARMAYACMCEKVVALPNFDRYENAQKEVRVAREMGKEVIAATGLERWFKRVAETKQEG